MAKQRGLTRRLFNIAALSLGVFGSPAFARETESWERLDLPTAPLFDAPGLETEMLDDLNAERRRHDRAPLTLDARLSAVARTYAREMLRERFIGHVAPNGTTFIERLQRAGLPATYMGENLAYTTGDENQAFTHLVASPGHLANMLNTRFTIVGIGAIAIGIYGTMYVQEFEGD
jgi:uncharacterized protein YkwD